MSDLIRRAKADCFKRHVSTGKCLVCELTDRIEELEKDLDQARAGCYACEPVAIENKRLTEKLEIEENAYDMLATQHDALQARVEKLEAALRIVPGFVTNRARADFVKDTLAATEQRDSDDT